MRSNIPLRCATQWALLGPFDETIDIPNTFIPAGSWRTVWEEVGVHFADAPNFNQRSFFAHMEYVLNSNHRDGNVLGSNRRRQHASAGETS